MAGNANIKPLVNMDNLSQGARGGAGEVLAYTYFDTATLATGQLEQRMFSIPLGQGTPAKTPSQTNMKLASQIPQGQRLTVQEIHFAFHCNNATIPEADLAKILHYLWTSSVTFKMPGKDDFGTWKLSEIFGQTLSAVITPSVAGDNIQVPYGLNSGKYPLQVPVILPQRETFEFVVHNDVAVDADLNGYQIYFGLFGALERLS